MFLANGLGFSNLVPRYPEILEHLGITKAAFGQAVMFNSIGALVAGLAASWLITRFTSARVASIGMMVLGLGLLGAGRADSWIVFALCMAWVGGSDAIVDVAQNAHGLRVERRWGGSIITSFHAAWSLGAVLGATMGQAMAGAGVPVETHMAGVLVLLTVVSGAALPGTIKGPDADDRSLADAAEDAAAGVGTVAAPVGIDPDAAATSPIVPSRAITALLVVVLGLMCAAAMFPEDVTGNWSSLLLTEQGAAPGMVGMGLVSLQVTMIVGRLLGDAVIDRLGARKVIAGGGVLVAVGMGTALLAGSVPGTLVGMVVSGAGCAVAVPVAYAAADDIPGLRPGMGLTVVSWLARVIMLVSPPIVGWFADAHGTWVALVYGLIGGIILMLSWPALRRGPRSNAAGQAVAA
ncbi:MULTISPECIES: MFS transporter [unclassified Actinomyces]|uniref:MFS transporter n=1 Tax=unclassified Actinomyces TaxID=2609248 RepID=UPI001373B1ED|nr:MULTISPECIES: MFS transporter [unclassified Actinomyces]NDR54031.1 MFS transporter [Actinomyces sp. 565]QHO92190.1 MFS transporter [Actinomyces sp. 432]